MMSREWCSRAKSAFRAKSASRTIPWLEASAASPWARAMAAVDEPAPPGPVTATIRPRHRAV